MRVTREVAKKKKPPLPKSGKKLLWIIAGVAVFVLILGLVLAGLSPEFIK